MQFFTPFASVCLTVIFCILSTSTSAAPIKARTCKSATTTASTTTPPNRLASAPHSSSHSPSPSAPLGISISASLSIPGATPSSSASSSHHRSSSAAASSSASAPTASSHGHSSSSAAPTSSHGKSSSSTGTATATGSAPSSSSSGGARFVIYTDEYVSGGNGLPSPDDIKGFNTLALSFLLSTGAADQAQQWATLSDSDRTKAKQAYTDAGIKLIVSAFGSTEEPTTSGLDATSTAQTMAKWVKQYDLDGIDVDYEDMTAFDNDPSGAIKWLEDFTTTLRQELPSGQYTISHAPVAPWFQKGAYGGGYLAIDQSVGDKIDWYNIQYYNQGSSSYTDCDSILTSSGSEWPGTSVFEINKNGVSLDKLVIGKPATSGDASNGYIAPATLAGCVGQAMNQGWNAGVMSWEFPSAKASWIQTVRGAAFPL